MPFNTGAVFANRYRTVELLGKGGPGAVYRGWDINQQARCAIKENTEISDEAARQFFREAQTLAGLNHTNLARVTDHFILPDQGLYLVMDFVDGEDLDALLSRGGPIPEGTLLPWVGQIVDALHYLHSQRPPVIHREIKPANIRITPQGKAVLVGFGIARVLREEPATPQSDIYALGATLYTLLTGLAPAASGQVIPPPSTLNPNVSQRTSWVVMKALEADPRSRFQSVLEIKRALNIPLSPGQVIPTEPQGANSAQGAAVFGQVPLGDPATPRAPHASTPPGQAAKPKTSKTMLVVLAILLFLCLGLIAAGALLLNNAGNSPADGYGFNGARGWSSSLALDWQPGEDSLRIEAIGLEPIAYQVS